MSSFYDRWGSLARYCAIKHVDPALACEMQERRLAQAESYYTWISGRRDARQVLPSPDPMAYNRQARFHPDWLYGDALEDIIGALPREEGFYNWARAALDRLRQLPAANLYGPPDHWADWLPWGLWTQMVVGNLHSFAHFVGEQTCYSDNPYRGGRRIPNWQDADEWCRQNFPEARRWSNY